MTVYLLSGGSMPVHPDTDPSNCLFITALPQEKFFGFQEENVSLPLLASPVSEEYLTVLGQT